MVRNLFLFFLVFAVPGTVLSQTPQVPSEMLVAGIELKITDGARKEIQTHVDALYRSEKYFQIKLDRVDLYFPIIERIFREENLPDDFKYLVIQESALISDAVSSSNAVGFWQFKKASGEEVGLRIDGAVDERLNIVSSSRGAARYLKRNNNYFGNWIYALLSYNTGAGGAQKIVDDKYFGAKKMEIDKRTHWYIVKFLAHKVAFENATGKNSAPELMLREYTTGSNKNLRQIAGEIGVDQQLLEDYNKWLKRGAVPDDKVYSVIIPTAYSNVGNIVARDYDRGSTTADAYVEAEKPKVTLSSRFSKGSDKYPIIEGAVQDAAKQAVLVKVNGKPGIIAGPDDNILELAEAGDIPISRFLKYNDLTSSDKAIPGQVYYLKAKRGRAAEHYHVVSASENLWAITQKYGIKLKKVLQKNRMEKGEEPKPGRVLWMRFVRPKDEPVEYRETASTEIFADNREKQQSTHLSGKEVEKERSTSSKVPEQSVGDTEPVKVEEGATASRQQVRTENVAETSVADPNETRVVKAPETERDYIEESDEDAFSSGGDFKFVDNEAAGPEKDIAGTEGIHRVKQGETLYSIARLYDIQVGEILLWNEISLRDEIKIDQRLKISPPEEQVQVEAENPVIKGEDFIIHDVASGETMYKIARDHNVTIKDVMQWNNKNDFGVSIGEKLKIKKPAN